jgi:hypothetical protein
MIRCHEQRNPALTVGNDAFCGKGPYSWLEHYTTLRAGAPSSAKPLVSNLTLSAVGETGLEPATPGPPDQHLFRSD